MSEPTYTMPNLADMAEASRLTQAGRLQEAADLVQRSMSGRPRAAKATRPSGHDGPSDHPSLLPKGLRNAIGKTLRSVAPSLKDFPAALKETGFRTRQPQTGGPDDERFVERNFANASGTRAYKLFIPSERQGRRPLVVMLHGCTQSPDDFAVGTRMNALAEERGIYVVYPHQTRSANAQKCWNWFEPGDQGRERGESGIIAGIVRAVSAEHDIDTGQIYIAGLSAGGAAAVNIARAYPDMFAAVGVHSGLAAACARDLSSALMAMRNGAPGAALPGGASSFGEQDATQSFRLPTIVFHGDDDATVNRRNGEAVLSQAGIASLRAVVESGGNGSERPYTRTRYTDAAGLTQAESWSVRGGGHAWFGGSSDGSYTDPKGPDASRSMLDFFAQHRLGKA